MVCAPIPSGDADAAALGDAAAGPDWADLTEQAILDRALILAASMGWSDQLVNLAGKKAGLSLAETNLLLPHGAADLAALLSKRHDGEALFRLNQQNPSALKIRGRIEAGIMTRLAIAAKEGQAAHAWAGYLALPHHLPLALRLVWDSADMIWRWAGDTATDENHYSKRALVGGILMASKSKMEGYNEI
jgi:ubiquinone biosynthesis protein COQ9